MSTETDVAVGQASPPAPPPPPTHREIKILVQTDVVQTVDVPIAPAVTEIMIPEDWFRASVRKSTS